MKTKMIVIACFLALLISGSVNYSPQSIPFVYEPNAVEGKLLGAVQGEVDKPIAIPLSCADAEGHPFVITSINPPAGFYVVSENSEWRIQWIPTVTGTYYITLEATDIPPLGITPETRQHTMIFVVLAPNTAPEIDALEDSLVAHIWPNDHLKRWQELKKDGTFLLGPVVMDLK